MNYVKSLGWFIRFVPPAQRQTLTKFYTDVIGLPFVREGSAQAVDFLWSGEALIHELIYEGRMTAPDPRDANPRLAPLVPIYRAHDLDALINTLRDKGATMLPVETGAFGRQTYVLDPSGSLVGFREVPAESSLTPDVVAAVRHRRGEAFNPGCTRMPTGIQELGWVVRRVSDLEAQTVFYRDVLGLREIGRVDGHVLLDLGDNSVLELAPGGVVSAPPSNRAEVSATIILRIQQIEAFRDDMRGRGVRIVHDLIQWARGALSYIADPEGNLIGIEEKYHPSRYAPADVPFPEDLESQRRWIEASAAR